MQNYATTSDVPEEPEINLENLCVSLVPARPVTRWVDLNMLCCLDT